MTTDQQNTTTINSKEIKTYKLSYASATDIGLKREENQDSYGIIRSKNYSLFVVADGMGGAKGGAIASKSAIETFSLYLENKSFLDVKTIIEGIKIANSNVFEQGKDNKELSGMGTTFVGIAIQDNKIFAFNVGDSRVYHIQDKEVKQITTDHTLINELIESGNISKEQAENHPISHMLTKSLGPAQNIDPDCFVLSAQINKDDIFLICSDGLHGLIKEKEIPNFINKNDLNTSCENLIKEANKRGGIDNITVILVKIDDISKKIVNKDAFQDSDNGNNTEKISLNPQLSQQNTDSDLTETAKYNLEEINTTQLNNNDQDISINESIDIHTLSGKLNQEEINKTEINNKDYNNLNKDNNNKSKSNNASFYIVGIILLIFFALYSFYYQRKPQINNQELASSIVYREETVKPPSQYNAKIASETSLNVKLNSNRGNLTETFLLPHLNKTLSLKSNDNLNKQYINTKQDSLLAKKTKVTTFLSSIGKPINNNLINILTKAQKKYKQINEEIKSLMTQLDKTTLKFEVWSGRKKRLERIDPINLANEVAISSKKVKEAKDLFERATWEYLRATEEYRYNPNNAKLKDTVAQYATLRNKRKEELKKAIIEVINNKVDRLEEEISSLMLKKHQLERELKNIEKEIYYAKIITKGSKKAQNNIKKELEKELLFLQAELSSNQ